MVVSVRLKMVILVALAVAGLPVHGQSMDIVKDGRAAAVIVVRQSGQDSAQARNRREPGRGSGGFERNDPGAARVLVDWIEKMSGGRLQIAGQAPTARPAIYIGAAAVRAGLELGDIDSPTNEGLRIVSDGKTKILIGGQNETSTMKAVCRFLEELGCRFFMDNCLGQVYPRRKTVTVGRLNITDKPGLMMRKIWGSQWGGQNLWKIWNGAGGLQLSTGHSWGRYVDKDLFETHPEYFALRDGERKKGRLILASEIGIEYSGFVQVWLRVRAERFF